MARKVWIEAAINGPWSQSRQPLIPVAEKDIVAEGIAMARAGAAIIHLHAYDESTGRQRDDWEIYARLIEGIREKVDAIVYPTIPLAGSSDSPRPMAAADRFAAVEELARRKLIEWCIVDPGSANFAHRDDLVAGRTGFVYLNPEDHVRHGLALAARYGFHPSYACYEPGFVRLGAALHRLTPGAPTPVYRVLFSEGFTFSFPPRAGYLHAYRALLREEVPDAPWMAAGLSVDIRPLVAEILELGGHLRIGLEDAPLGDERSNGWWLDQALAAVADAGHEVAAASDVRAALAGSGAGPG